MQIGQAQLGVCRPIDEIAFTTPLISQFRVRQRIAGNDFERNRSGQQAIGTLRHRIQRRHLSQLMIQLHRAGFTPNTINSNQVGDPLLRGEHHLTVLAVISTVIVAGHFLYGIPSCPATDLVNCQDGVKITVARVYLGRAFLIRSECRPCGGATRGARMVGLTRVLGRPSGVVYRRTGERELSRLLLNLPQLCN